MGFIAGTRVRTTGGFLAIEQLQISMFPITLPHLLVTPLVPVLCGPSSPQGPKPVWDITFSNGLIVTMTGDQLYLSRDEGWNWILDVEPEDFMQRRSDPPDQFLDDNFGLPRGNLGSGVWVEKVIEAGIQPVWEVSLPNPKMYYVEDLLVRS